MTYRVAQKIQESSCYWSAAQRNGQASHWQLAVWSLLTCGLKTLFENFIVLSSPFLPLFQTTHYSYPYNTTFPSHNTAKMSDQGDEISQVTYEQLAGIEDEFEEIDTQISTSSPRTITHNSRKLSTNTLATSQATIHPLQTRLRQAL